MDIKIYAHSRENKPPEQWHLFKDQLKGTAKRAYYLFKQGDYVAHRRFSDGRIQSLSEHLEETASYAGKFASKVGLNEQGELIGFLHDFGKASREFEQYIKSAVGLIDPDEDDYVDVAGIGPTPKIKAG